MKNKPKLTTITYLGWDGIEWDDYPYIYWFNWLDKDVRYWGREDMYYDGMHKSFGFWYFNISWRL